MGLRFIIHGLGAWFLVRVIVFVFMVVGLWFAFFGSCFMASGVTVVGWCPFV